jgi:hypothetical protein
MDDGKGAYQSFLRSSGTPFGLRSLAFRLRIEYEDENLERIALELAAHRRLCVLVGRDGRVREVARPSQR